MRQLFLLASAGALIGLSFLIALPWFVPCVVFTLILFVLLQEHNARARLLLGYVAGLCILGGAFFAIFWHALPLDWAVDARPLVQIFFVGLAWILITAVGALPIAAWGFVLPYVSFKDSRDILTIPSLFVLCEWLAACLMEFGMSGSGSLQGPHFGNGFLGLTIADSLIPLQVTAYGGVYALSFIVVASGVFFLGAILGNDTKRIIGGIIVLACITSASLAFEHAPVREGTFRISSLSTHVPPLRGVPAEESRAHSEAIYGLLKQTPQSEVLLVPEATDFIGFAARENIPLAELVHGGVLIDSGSLRASEQLAFRRVTYLDTATQNRSFTYKRFLVSTGEYLPYVFMPFIHVSSAVRELAESRRYVSGPESRPSILKGVPAIALSCNEIFSPELYRQATRDGAQILLNIASHSWYDHSHAVYLQTLRAGRVRAAENQKPLVVANNRAPAYALDRYGRTLRESSFGTAGIITVSVLPNSIQTPYSRLGSTVLLLPFFITVGALIHNATRRYRITEASVH